MKKNILLLGFTGTIRDSLQKSIEKLGGNSLQRFSNAGVDYLVCASDAFSKPTCIKAKKTNIPIITEEWIYESIKQNKLKSVKRSLDTPDISSSSKVLKSSNESPQPISPNSFSSSATPSSEEIELIRGKLYEAIDVDPVFLNRLNESKELENLLYLQKTSEKGILPILSQHYGSGKTQLVVKFRKVLEKENFSTSGFDLLKKAALVVLDFQRIPSLATNDNLEFLSAVVIDMIQTFKSQKRNNSSMNNSKDDILTKSITVLEYCLLYICSTIPTLEKLTINMENEEKLMYHTLLSELSFPQFFKAWSNQNLMPVIFFFDEYQRLNEKDQLVKFWEQNLSPLMGKTGDESNASNVFIVIAGKSSDMAKLGRGFLNSNISRTPSPAKHLVLDMLTVNHITTIMETTMLFEGYTMKDLLFHFYNMSNDSFQYFCNKVFVYTGGIPRIVKYVMTSLVKNILYSTFSEIDLSTSYLIDHQFDKTLIFTYVTNSYEMTSLTNILTKEYEIIILLGCFGVPIPFDFENCSMIKQVYELNVGLEMVSESQARLVIPWFTLYGRNFKEASLFFKTTQSLLKDSHLNQIIDNVNLKERLVLDLFAFRLVSHIISKETGYKLMNILSFFSNSKLKDLPLVACSESVLLPRITSLQKLPQKEIEGTSKVNPWTSTVSDENWKDVFKQFFQKGTFQIGIPAPKSNSGDIVLFFPPDKICNLLIKNESTELNITDLQEDINKCSRMIPYCSFVSVVVFCPNINDNVESLKLESGVWALGKNGVSVEVWENMELILLGKDQFNSFFTTEDLTILNTISNETELTFDKMLPWIKSNIENK